MATRNSRDVRMSLSVETLGAEDIQKLQSTIANLAKEGGDAAPEFQQLADQIGRIGEQAQALQAFTSLTEQTADLKARQDQAAQSSEELRTKLDALSSTTQQAAAHQQQVATELAAARQAARDTRDELATLTATTSRAGKEEEAYAAAVQRLKLAKIEQRAEIERLSASLQDANRDVKAAEQAEGKLAAQYDRAQRAMEQATRALETNNAQVREAAQSANSLGVGTDDIAASQVALRQALSRTANEAEGLQLRIEALADAERELAATKVFEKQVEEASHLLKSIQYAELFDEALRRLTESQRRAQEVANAEKWQREADAIVDAAHAAQELARQTQVLEAAQAELAAQRAFEKQAQDAEKLRQAADYVRFWREELDKAEDQARKTAEEARLSADRIKSAFGTLGVRSANDLQMEIREVRAAMETVRTSAGLTGGALNTAFAAGEARIRELERELRKVNGTMTLADRSANLLKNSLGQIAAGNIIADGVGYLVNKVKELAAAFVQTIVETEQLRRGLMALYRDSATVASQFNFLRQTANAAGVSVGSIQQAFVRFSAATKASGIALETTNRLFAEITRAAGTLGLSGEQVSGMLEALGQMASKGTVSMEELRQQLGDRLPGALSMVAQGLGLTEAQLVKLVENGGLAARDLFPALTKALGQMRGETDGLRPSWERLKNVLTQTAQEAGDAGWTQLLTAGLKGLTVVLGAVAIPLAAVSELIFGIARAVGILVGAIATLSNPMEALGEVVKGGSERLGRLTNAFVQAAGGSDDAAEAAARHQVAMQSAGTAAAQSTTAIEGSTRANQAQAFAAKLAADGNIDLSSKIVQLKAYIDELLGSQEKEIEASAKLAKAAQIEGDSLVRLAELRGNDFETLEAQVVAADKNTAALARLSQAQQVETQLLIQKRDEIVKTALAQDGNTEQRKVEIEEINKKILASQAETAQVVQTAAAARQEAEARRLAIETYKDNSARIGEYRAAMEASQAALERLTQAEKDGWATKQQVEVAAKMAAEATHLYNDAIGDSIRALDLESRAKQANTNLTLTKIQIEQRNYESLAQAARASGDYTLALEFEISARRKQIEAIRVASEAKRLEAEATLKALEIERAAISQSDPLLKQKQAEVDIRIANAKAKLLEANAGRDAIAALEREITLLRQNGNERDGSRHKIDQDTVSRERNAAAINKQTSALEKQNLTSDGFKKNADGAAAGQFNNSLPVNIAHEIARKLRDGSLGADDLDAAKTAVEQARNAQQWLHAIPPGARSTEAMSTTDALVRETQRALGIVQEQARRQERDKDGGVSRPGSSTPAPERGSGKTITVNIGGRRTNVNVASDQDANNLTSILRQLESAAGASA